MVRVSGVWSGDGSVWTTQRVRAGKGDRKAGRQGAASSMGRKGIQSRDL